MEINRHNCEEWFLLYADDELDAAGKRKVEEFVACHPDKAVLLEGFLNARFKPDDNLLFDGKQSLRKKGEDALSEAEWERFLLMADGESTALIWLEPSLSEQYICPEDPHFLTSVSSP